MHDTNKGETMREIIEDAILASCYNKIVWGRWRLLSSLQATIEVRLSKS